MKTKIFTLALVATIVCSALSANAKIRRVGYLNPGISGTDYSSLQSAHDAANTGDTLLIFPGTYNGTAANFTKRLIVIGYGYFVNSTNLGTGANDSLQAIVGTLSISINLNPGCDTSVFEGLDGLTLYAIEQYGNNPPLVTLNDILVSRCNLTFNLAQSSNYIFNNLTISQCYINNFYNNSYVNSSFNNLSLTNNYISSITFAATSPTGSGGVLTNNIFASAPNFNNISFLLENNIFLSTTAPSGAAQCNFYYNIASNNTIPSGTGEQPNVNIDSVFVGYPNIETYSNDGRYALAPNSPAKGAGAGSGGTITDCGIFGGSTPYHLSGIPPIPAFYAIYPSYYGSVTTNPFKIYFSVRGNN